LPVNKTTDSDPVGHILEGEDIFRLLAGDPQFPGTGAGGDDQPVVGQGDFLPAGLVPNLNPAVGPVDGQGQVLQSDVDPLLGLKFLRSAGDQFRVVLDYITDVIGQLSGADGDKFSLFQHGNIGLGRFPPGAAGRRGSGRRSADDHYFQFFSHEILLLLEKVQLAVDRKDEGLFFRGVFGKRVNPTIDPVVAGVHGDQPLTNPEDPFDQAGIHKGGQLRG